MTARTLRAPHLDGAPKDDHISERYHLTEMMRRRALNGDRRATQFEQGAKVAEHRLEIEQRDKRALRAQVTRLRLKREAPAVRAVIPTVTMAQSQTDLVRASLLIREGSASKTKRKARAGK